MNRLFLRIVGFLAALGLSGFLPISSATAAERHISDSGSLVSEARSSVLESKLEQFERATGIRILFEFHPKSPTEAEDSAPSVYMRTLSAKLGVLESGVLAVYFADEDDWRVWIGDALTARFVGKPGTALEHTESGAMHDAKEAWLEEVFAKADLAGKLESGESPKLEARVAFAAEAIADGLIAKFPPVVDASAPIPKANNQRFFDLHESFLARAKEGPIGLLFIGD